jgi:hypothetical protein
MASMSKLTFLVVRAIAFLDKGSAQLRLLLAQIYLVLHWFLTTFGCESFANESSIKGVGLNPISRDRCKFSVLFPVILGGTRFGRLRRTAVVPAISHRLQSVECLRCIMRLHSVDS